MAHPGGRPPKYNAVLHPKLAKALSSQGKTDAQIAEEMEIAESTLYEWILSHPEFSEEIKKGRQSQVPQVVGALFKRAMGYEIVETEQEGALDSSGKMVITKIKKRTKHIPSDTLAKIYFLNNRDPENWKQQQTVEHRGTIKTGIESMTDAEIEAAIEELEKKEPHGEADPF